MAFRNIRADVPIYANQASLPTSNTPGQAASTEDGGFYVWNGSNWIAQGPESGLVDSVNGQTGIVVLDADDVGADPAGTAEALFDELGDLYVRTTRFAIISSGSSGTVTLPPSATVILDDFGGTVDAVVTKVSSGKPSIESAVTAGGVVIATTFDSLGNWVFSGTPSSYPVAILYRVEQQLKNFDSTASNIFGIPLAQAGSSWGAITGTLSNQSDLQNVLDNKLNLIESYTTVALPSNLDLIPVSDGADTFNVTLEDFFSRACEDGNTKVWNDDSDFTDPVFKWEKNGQVRMKYSYNEGLEFPAAGLSVSFSSATDGQFLIFNDVSQSWEPGNGPGLDLDNAWDGINTFYQAIESQSPGNLAVDIQPATDASLSYVLSASGILANGTAYNYEMYSQTLTHWNGYWYSQTSLEFDSPSDPNDGLLYEQQLSWVEPTFGATVSNYILYDTINNRYLEIVAPATSFIIDATTSWTAGAPVLTPNDTNQSIPGFAMVNGDWTVNSYDLFRLGIPSDPNTLPLRIRWDTTNDWIIFDDGISEVYSWRGNFIAGGTTDDSFEWLADTSSPTPQTILTLPLDIYGDGTINELLGTPDKWVLVTIEGVEYKIPTYL